MSVIPHSQFLMVRLRRQIENALNSRDWVAVQDLNPQLMKALDEASRCSYRNLPSLVAEVEQVVRLYRQLLSACDEHAREVATELL